MFLMLRNESAAKMPGDSVTKNIWYIWMAQSDKMMVVDLDDVELEESRNAIATITKMQQ